jgi:hypothetical protein
VKTYVDTLAALVPAEILAAFAVLLPLFTSTKTNPDDDSSLTTVTDLGALQLTVLGLLVVSIVLYLLGRPSDFDRWDVVRALIPPSAFVGWITLQHPAVFEAMGGPDWSTAVRTTVTVIGAILLGAIATVLAYKADQAQ